MPPVPVPGANFRALPADGWPAIPPEPDTTRVWGLWSRLVEPFASLPLLLQFVLTVAVSVPDK